MSGGTFDAGLVGWGRDYQGDLPDATDHGAGTAVLYTSPTEFPNTVGAVTALASGGGSVGHGLILAEQTAGDPSTAQLYAYGNDNFGQCGQGAGTALYYVSPVRVVGVSGDGYDYLDEDPAGIALFQCGVDHSLVLMGDGSCRSFGRNNYGQLGNGGTVSTSFPVKVLNVAGTAALTGIDRISAGDGFSAVRTASGSAGYWFGSLCGSDGTARPSGANLPTAMPNVTWGVDTFGIFNGTVTAGGTAPLARVLELSQNTGGAQTLLCAIEHPSFTWETVVAFGANQYGQTGRGTTDSTWHGQPTQVRSPQYPGTDTWSGLLDTLRCSAELSAARDPIPPTTYPWATGTWKRDWKGGGFSDVHAGGTVSLGTGSASADGMTSGPILIAGPLALPYADHNLLLSNYHITVSSYSGSGGGDTYIGFGYLADGSDVGAGAGSHFSANGTYLVGTDPGSGYDISTDGLYIWMINHFGGDPPAATFDFSIDVVTSDWFTAFNNGLVGYTRDVVFAGSPPSNWQTVAYDDSGWTTPVGAIGVDQYPNLIGGWATELPGSINEELVERQTGAFDLSSIGAPYDTVIVTGGTIVVRTLKAELTDLYVNGTALTIPTPTLNNSTPPNLNYGPVYIYTCVPGTAVWNVVSPYTQIIATHVTGIEQSGNAHAVSPDARGHQSAVEIQASVVGVAEKSNSGWLLWGVHNPDADTVTPQPQYWTSVPANLVDQLVGATHAVLLDNLGNVYAHGRNDYGQQGNGTSDATFYGTAALVIANNPDAPITAICTMQFNTLTALAPQQNVFHAVILVG